MPLVFRPRPPPIASCPHPAVLFAGLVLVAALWGVTNPLLKAASTPPPRARTRASDGSTGSVGALSPFRSRSVPPSRRGVQPPPTGFVPRLLATLPAPLGGAVATVLDVRFSVPLVLNQLGGVLYNWLLRCVPLSVAMPAANGLAFAFTAATVGVMGEGVSPRTGVGAALVVGGVAVCCAALGG